MSKFKIGDKVRVVENASGGHPEGTVGKIVNIDDGNRAHIKATSEQKGRKTYVHRFYHIEKVKDVKKDFAVDDVVIIKKDDSNGHADGTLGRVTRVFSGSLEVIGMNGKWKGMILSHKKEEVRKVAKYDKHFEQSVLAFHQLKIEVGDVVVVKENLSRGLKESALARVKSLSPSGSNALLEPLEGGLNKYHTMKELRKVKRYDK